MTMIQNTPAETSFLNGISGGLLHTPAHHPLSRDVRDGNYPETPKSIRDLVAAEDALAALADRERTTPPVKAALAAMRSVPRGGGRPPYPPTARYRRGGGSLSRPLTFPSRRLREHPARPFRTGVRSAWRAPAR